MSTALALHLRQVAGLALRRAGDGRGERPGEAPLLADAGRVRLLPRTAARAELLAAVRTLAWTKLPRYRANAPRV